MSQIKKPTLIYEFWKKTNEKKVRRRKFGLYKCSCGKEFEVLLKSINSGRTKSCGCYQKQRAKNAKITHGLSYHPIYRTWSGMKSRCYNEKDYHFEWYGAMGIKICQEWLKSFTTFYEWALNNGWEKSLEIDRIDNDKGYFPSNCRFTTKTINLQNTREITKANTSGYRNIYFVDNRYRVIIKSKHIGMYKTLEEAIISRNKNHTRKFNEQE